MLPLAVCRLMDVETNVKRNFQGTKTVTREETSLNSQATYGATCL